MSGFGKVENRSLSDDPSGLVVERSSEFRALEMSAMLEESEGSENGGETQGRHQFYFFPSRDEIELSSRANSAEYGFPERPKPLLVVLMACCPCLTQNPCSEEKKQEYASIPRRIVFGVSTLQVILFVLSIMIDGIAPLSENWMIGPTRAALVSLGAKYGPLMRYNFEMWRIITPIFLHTGIIQLMINIFYQLRMGLYLEPRWGWNKFLVIYICCGSSGVVMSCLITPNTVSVASSFAMIGVMGVWFARLHTSWRSLEGWQKKMNLSLCLCVMGVIFLEGVGPSFIDSIGHLGGLLMGLYLGYVHFLWNTFKRKDELVARAIAIVGTLLVVLYFLVTMSIFFSIIPVDLPIYNPAPQTELYSYTNISIYESVVEILESSFISVTGGIPASFYED